MPEEGPVIPADLKTSVMMKLAEARNALPDLAVRGDGELIELANGKVKSYPISRISIDVHAARDAIQAAFDLIDAEKVRRAGSKKEE